MKILCHFDGHNFQPVPGSQYSSTVTEYLGDKVISGPNAAIGYVKRCKRCGYETIHTMVCPAQDSPK